MVKVRKEVRVLYHRTRAESGLIARNDVLTSGAVYREKGTRYISKVISNSSREFVVFHVY